MIKKKIKENTKLPTISENKIGEEMANISKKQNCY